MNKIKILTIFGTRPEVIKLATFIKAVATDMDCVSITCATTQHKELQNDVLNLFGISVDHDLNIMKDGQDLFHITESVLNRIKTVLDKVCPDFVVVQGDTTTAFAAALSSFYCQIPVVHIEAGLRTGNMQRPYPEEANRILISKLASLHMAPTQQAVQNLAKEGIVENVFNVGNTIVDAIALILSQACKSTYIEKLVQQNRKKVLITVHRRENFDKPLKEICRAMTELAQHYKDFHFIWPVHPNPNIKNYVNETMATVSNVELIEPLSYSELVRLMNSVQIILSDSGGIQEEACILGKPIIILREETERPEVIESGFGILTGADINKIKDAFATLLNFKTNLNHNMALSVYGAPGMSQNIVTKIKDYQEKIKYGE